MKNQFHVTGHGLQIDGRGIMPGSVLVLKSQPPSHWQRFGEISQVREKTLIVATPLAEEKTVKSSRHQRKAP